MTCSRRIERGRYEDAEASSTAPRGLHVLAGRCFDLQSAYQTAFGLYPLLFYKESAFGLCRFSWLHQGRIPRHTCRFYCCLAAHQRTRKKDSAEPSFPILWTPPHPPGGIRCGGAYLLPRVWDNIGSYIPVQVAHPQVRIWIFYLCSGWGFSRFSRFRWACIARFSLLGGWIVRSCGYVWFCYGL